MDLVMAVITPKVSSPSRISSESGLMELLHVLKKAEGRDYINVDRSNVNNMTLRWIYHIGGKGWSLSRSWCIRQTI